MDDKEQEELDQLGKKLIDTNGKLSQDDLFRYFELLEDERSEEISNEIWDAKFLVVNKAIEPNIFNTYEWVNNCVERLKDPLHPLLFSDIFPSSEPVNWKSPPDDAPGLHLVDDYDRGLETLERYQEFLSEEAWDASEDDPFYIKTPVYPTPIELLIAEIRRGNQPAPELLLSLGKAFDLYFASGGELSLEEVFFGSHKADDIRAKRRIDTFKGISLRDFHHCVLRDEGDTLEGLVLHFFKQYNTENPELKLIPEQVPAFLKKYRRWKESEGYNDI